jgi:hypothetical protein
MKNHLKQDCPERKVQCQYCEISISFKYVNDYWFFRYVVPISHRAVFPFTRERFSHESACGSITEQCENCNRRITRREKFGHICDQPGSPSTPSASPFGGPAPAVNRYTGFGSETFVCEKCQAPCEGFDELQVHYLTTHADEEVPGAESS